MVDDVFRLNDVNSAFSGKYLLASREDGNFPAFGIVNLPFNDIDQSIRTLDWGGNDPYIDSLRKAQTLLFQEIDRTQEKLLAQNSWDYSDRLHWEGALHHAARVSMETFPLFNRYQGFQNFPEPSLNKMSFESQFRCGEKCITELALAQSAEYHFLNGKDGGYRKPYRYFCVIGWRESHNNKPPRHALIFSEATAAAEDPTYKQFLAPLNPQYRFEDLVAGKPFHGEDGNNHKVGFSIGEAAYGLAHKMAPGEFVIEYPKTGKQIHIGDPFWDAPKPFYGPPVPLQGNHLSNEGLSNLKPAPTPGALVTPAQTGVAGSTRK